MKKVLIIIGHYVPGYKDGGPVRSIINLTDQLGDEFAFSVLTLDRDAGDVKAYPELQAVDAGDVQAYSELQAVDAENVTQPGKLQAVKAEAVTQSGKLQSDDAGRDETLQALGVKALRQGKAVVYYAPQEAFGKRTIEILSRDKDVMYIPGFFNAYGMEAIKAWRGMKESGGHYPRLVFAPMGIFTPGAFRIRYPKKKAYCMLMRLLGMTKGICWSVSNEEEARDTRRQMGKRAKCMIAQDLPRLLSKDVLEAAGHKQSSGEGALRVVALSRISEKKNFAFIPDIMTKVSGDVTLDIYGYMEDPNYWEICLRGLEKLPDNIKWNYCGAVEPEQVIPVLREYDVFLFPTTAENYGHVIIEALSAGTIPVISDRTPWTAQKLSGVGNVLPLGEGTGTEESAIAFAQALSAYVQMDAAVLKEQARACAQFAIENQATDVEVARGQYRAIFEGGENA